MPAKINMFISNGNIFPPPISAPQTRQLIRPNVPLNAGMIARIHSIKPGCGSCGRKG